MPKNQDIIFSELPGQDGHLGHILLNRPQVLNALSTAMVVQLSQHLQGWGSDPRITAVVITSNSDRAFCAGGDIRAVYDNKMHLTRLENFFRIEYHMNKCLFHFRKPYIALIDGIIMGGGAGISLHGSHRIGTERLLFAMPETSIGFFPDVGTSHWLSRYPNKIGYYLGLTGHRIGPADTQKLGLTTHIIASDKKTALLTALTQTPLSQHPFESVSQTIDRFSIACTQSHDQANEKNIAYCFSATTVEALLEKLKNLNNAWGRATIDLLLKRSPTALKITLEQLNRAAHLDFDALMDMELNIALQFLRTPDFFEGIRATIIDKDQCPQWHPPTLSAVTRPMVDAFFLAEKHCLPTSDCPNSKEE